MRNVDALLGTIVEVAPDQQSTLLELIEGWAGHVHRLFSEHGQDPPPRDAWGMHDYVAALHIRDRVERGLATLGLVGGEPHIVRVADELFKKFTAKDVDGALRHYPDDLPTEPWWWARTPVSGQVATELDQMPGNV